MQDDDARLLQDGETFGPFVIARLIGKRGMGEVYEARDTRNERSVALKLISPGLLEGGAGRDRMAQAAEDASRLAHPNIVTMDSYEIIDDQQCLCMEFVPGVGMAGSDAPVLSLEEYSEANGGLICEQDAQAILSDILEGLAYAHDQGVIHGNIKPANILLHREDPGALRAKLTDFALIRAVGAQSIHAHIRLSISRSRIVAAEVPADPAWGSGGRNTKPNQRELSFISTYDFMAPEVKGGRDGTEQSDLYAVGVLAHWMLTGSRVLSPRRVSELVSGLGERWDAWIAEATEIDPARRPESASTMRTKLHEEPSGPEQGENATQRFPLSTIVCAVAVVWTCLLAVFVVIKVFSDASAEPSESAPVETVPSQETPILQPQSLTLVAVGDVLVQAKDKRTGEIKLQEAIPAGEQRALDFDGLLEIQFNKGENLRIIYQGQEFQPNRSGRGSVEVQ